jgi:hypothetical protein
MTFTSTSLKQEIAKPDVSTTVNSSIPDLVREFRKLVNSNPADFYEEYCIRAATLPGRLYNTDLLRIAKGCDDITWSNDYILFILAVGFGNMLFNNDDIVKSILTRVNREALNKECKKDLIYYKSRCSESGDPVSDLCVPHFRILH